MDAGTSKIVTDYLKRVQAVVWNRRLMKTKDGERLGLVPDNAREGDKVCILRGCSVPVVLREVDEDGATVILGRTPTQGSYPDDSIRKFRYNVTAEKNHAGPSSAHQAATDPKSEKVIKAKIIGECYIHGVMDGEAFRIRDQQGLTDVKFELI
jgi:hypothetical protein